MEDLIAEHRVPRPAFSGGSLHSFFKDRGTPTHHTEMCLQPPLCQRAPNSLSGNTYSSINGASSGFNSGDGDPNGGPGSHDSNCYCKILVSNHLAGIIIGSSGNEIKNLKQSTGAKIVLSPHGMYFPGTTERLAAIEGSEQAVFQVVDWILDKMTVHAAAPVSPSPSPGSPGATPTQSLSAPCIGTGDQQADREQNLRPLQCLRICVPRAVVGSLIGKNGGYIQSLRVATGACINISPLFVNADEACAERIVSVESKKKHRLKTAALTLIRKINAHPDKGSCRHVCYYRKHNFMGADMMQQQPPLLQKQPQHLEDREQPEVQRDELLHQQTLLQQKSRLQGEDEENELQSLQQKTESLLQQKHSEQRQLDLAAKQQKRQQLQEPEQQAIDALRLRTVSLVLGTAKRDPASISDSSGSSQFAAFRRFCESRNGASAHGEGPASAPQMLAAEAAPAAAAARSHLGSKANEAAQLSILGGAAAAAGPRMLAAAAAAPGKTTTMSFESLSTVCSSTTGSTDRLPSIRDISIVTTENNAVGSAAGDNVRSRSGVRAQPPAADAAPQAEAAAPAAGNQELRQLLQLGVLFALLLSVVLHLLVQLFK